MFAKMSSTSFERKMSTEFAGSQSKEDLTSNELLKSEHLVESLRKLVREYLELHCYETALFWADKLITLMDNSIRDLFTYLNCLYNCQQYQRALHLIKEKELHKVASKEYEQALEILNWDEMNNGVEKVFSSSSTCQYENLSTFTLNSRNIESAIYLLRAQVHETLGCSDAAVECYKSALEHDVFCYEALMALSGNHMLTYKDENTLIQNLAYENQCTEKEAQLVKYIYATKLSRPSKQTAQFEQNQSCIQVFKENLDLLINKAERLYYDGDFESAYKICRKVLERDQFHKTCVPLYVSTLVHLNKVTQLFEIAHSLVKQYPQDAVSWFAVGCYYFLIGNMDPARKFFLKATCLNRSFSPAWLALGHSFAQESEHDQATSAYFTAAQIMKGSFLPFLYIGLEYTLSNNLKLAERFYQQALNVECDDPFVLHELGVIWFKSQNYQNAEISMRRAYNKLKTISHKNIFKEWEPLLNNLGHVCRKLKKYQDSLEFHRKALALQPTNASTWTSIGLTFIFLNKFDEAIEYFHQALWYKKTDLVAKKLLDKCLNLYKDNPALILPDDFELDIMDIMLDKQNKQKVKSVSTSAQKAANKPHQPLSIREANENMSISDSITYAPPTIDPNQLADATNTETDDSAMDLVASADESSLIP